jgi:hypothetical protein
LYVIADSTSLTLKKFGGNVMKLRLILILVVFTCNLIVPVNAQTPRYARVISGTANLRDTPSIPSGSEQQIDEGTIVKVLDEKLLWYVVRAGNRVGWMHGNTIEFIDTEVSVPATQRRQAVTPDYTPSTPSVPRRESSTEEPAHVNGASGGYIRGPRGGCYYISGSGRKIYVDRSMCN